MKRNHGLDILKAICAFMVVCIHEPFPGIAGNITLPLTRIAVPLFFMITGYYYSHTKERKREKKQLLKIFQLFVGANLLFFAWSLGKEILIGSSAAAYLGSTLNVNAMVKFILLNQSPFSSHLWYLGAILYVLVIVFVFEKKWSRKLLYPLVPVLLLTDLVLGKYSLLLLGKEFPYILVRNFLCVGLPYFLIGDMLYVRNVKVKSGNAGLMIVAFVCTTLLERFALGALHANAARDHYISTTFLSVYVFLLAVQHESKRSGKMCQVLSFTGAKLSTSIYILHPIFITVFAKAVKLLSGYLPISTLYSWTAPIVIFVFTAIVSMCLQYAAEKMKGSILQKNAGK